MSELSAAPATSVLFIRDKVMEKKKSETEFRLRNEAQKAKIKMRQDTVSKVYKMFEGVIDSQNWYVYLGMVILLQVVVENLYDTTRHAITPYCDKSIRRDLIRALSK